MLENQSYIRGLLDAVGMMEKLYANVPRAKKKTVLSLMRVIQRDYQVLKENSAALTGLRVSPQDEVVGLYAVK